MGLTNKMPDWAWLALGSVGLASVLAILFGSRSAEASEGSDFGGRLPPSSTDYKDVLTLAQLRLAMPGLSESKAKEYYPYLAAAMKEYGITTPFQRAAFLATLAHESMDLRYFEEIASGEAYEGRTDLGNTQPGDGRKYKGRGPIQLTGRFNYRTAGNALGLPLENNPKMATNIDVAFRIAGWFWKKNNIGPVADAQNFYRVASIVNGDPPRNYDDRLARYNRSLLALGIV